MQRDDVRLTGHAKLMVTMELQQWFLQIYDLTNGHIDWFYWERKAKSAGFSNTERKTKFPFYLLFSILFADRFSVPFFYMSFP